jgi:hypothetical protein
MKLRSLSLVLLVVSSVNAWAGPCEPIMSACEANGFYKGGAAEHKGLLQDCIKPITEGQVVAGIKISPDVRSACKAKLIENGY